MDLSCFWVWLRRFFRRKFHSTGGTFYSQQTGSHQVFVNFVNSQTQTEAEQVRSLEIELFSWTKNSCRSLEIPLNIGRFHHLLSLTVTGCGLTNLPWSFVYLKSLVYLDLSHNKFICLPNFIGCLTSLETLNLESNTLMMLPTALIELTNLKILNLANNETLVAPSYAICMRGIPTVMRALAMRSSRKNLWQNSKAYYDPADSTTEAAGDVPTLVVLAVNVILQSDLDYLSQAHVPKKLKSLIREKLDEKRKSLNVAKCSSCMTYFSNVIEFEGHVCKQQSI
ncbi:unnamed protein product [Lymnaea stagnalis]|uniref:Disease resistance R13L4/SHOC-2-like LRR domain-containing protein n=1 Tax=Lymnaea stagnalis TaxID=6523 RepID=A0AAV2GYF7_LYMST